MIGRYPYSLLALALTGLIAATPGCSLFLSSDSLTPEAVNQHFDSASITTPYATTRELTDHGGGFQTVHGMSCASAASAVSADNSGRVSYGVGVEESMPVPSGYVGTVFLNGWRLKYHSADHEVLALSTAIVDIEQRDGELRWTAGGVLSDGNGDDDFSWCYHYTALLWQPSNFDEATAYDSDASAELTFLLDHEGGYAQSVSQGNVLADFDRPPGALLPRGFGVIYKSGDHHLKDFALKYGDSDFVINSEDGSGSDIFWQHQTVFGDKGFDDAYVAGELVTVITGEAVATTVGDFAVTDGLNNGGSERSIIRRTVTVEVPAYDYAVPALNGWSLGSAGGDDSHIKEIGAWIERFSYSPPTSSSAGRLTYTVASIFRDKGSTGARAPEHQVDIVGFNSSSLAHTTVPVTTGTMTMEDGDSSSPSSSSTSLYDFGSYESSTTSYDSGGSSYGSYSPYGGSYTFTR